MTLRLQIEGASADEQRRGIEAAKAVFAEAGMTAEQAADGMFALEGWDDAGFPEDSLLTEEEDEAASIWMNANKAAIAACCANWPPETVPPYLLLELLD